MPSDQINSCAQSRERWRYMRACASPMNVLSKHLSQFVVSRFVHSRAAHCGHSSACSPRSSPRCRKVIRSSHSEVPVDLKGFGILNLLQIAPMMCRSSRSERETRAKNAALSTAISLISKRYSFLEDTDRFFCFALIISSVNSFVRLGGTATIVVGFR
jgi:hypothetical protein